MEVSGGVQRAARAFTLHFFLFICASLFNNAHKY